MELCGERNPAAFFSTALPLGLDEGSVGEKNAGGDAESAGGTPAARPVGQTRQRTERIHSPRWYRTSIFRFSFIILVAGFCCRELCKI